MRRLAFIILSIISVSCKPSFNSDEWKKDESVRHEQADDLIESEILLGKTYKEIFEILGDCDLDSRLHDTVNNEGSFSIQYILGVCNVIDFERLVIKFEKGRAIEAFKNCD
ncbi:MAG: hypothetical protein CVU11_01385 [Bacteroidetes bacterium HGW-Bacteroidetes-6]|nr:MAG: hypothetical protein CVU11_01385 [Bacteroidetes bacterium HGW-Bacteroidetes-6]